MAERTPFGTLDGRPISLVTLTDGAMSVELLPYGAAIRAIRVPDRDGKIVDVCLGYETAEEYARQDACFGGTIGRCANRIGGAEFSIDGVTYPLTANEGKNQLHGGLVGFHKKWWTDTIQGNRAVFTLDSPDGEEGFPGNLHAEVAYTLCGGVLTMEYTARCDRDTVVNLTNHAYFNLAGQAGGRVDDHRITVRADAYTPAGSDNVPTGVIAPVEGTPLDLRHGAWVGETADDPFFAATRGFDQNFVLTGDGAAAELWCPRTGIGMALSTTLPGMQVYSAGFLTERPGKDGAVYGQRHAICLEPQFFPDAVHHENFASPILRAGQEYHQTISYRFFTKG